MSNVNLSAHLVPPGSFVIFEVPEDFTGDPRELAEQIRSVIPEDVEFAVVDSGIRVHVVEHSEGANGG